MARVFLSHSSRDNASVGRMKIWLEQQGFVAPFLDIDKHAGIPLGADWEKTLYREIDQSQAMLILQSTNWSASKWCFAEFTQARALGKPIFQVIEATDGDPGPSIAPDLQVLDLRQEREAGLEQLKNQLVDIALTAQGGFPWDGTRSPYPGLPAFEEEDAAIYFGRDEEIRHLMERLNARRTLGGPRLLVLLGASGSGKSSLLRAGVLPRLGRSGRGWLVVPPFRPQSQPCQELARALTLVGGHGTDWRDLHRSLLEGDRCGTLPAVLASIAGNLRMAVAANEAQILLSVDQGEELFGGLEPEEARRFFRILTAAMGGDLPFLAVMTLRSEFLGRLQAAEKDGLTTRFEEVSLAPMALAQIPAVIKGPARVAGLEVEEAFVQQAAADAQTEDALPLLAFALRRLYERFGSDGHLSLADYQDMGDAQADLSPLENAVRNSADEVLGKQTSEEEMKALRDAFVPAMVRLEQGNYVRRPARWDALPIEAQPLLEKLVSARLLISRQEEGHRLLEVAHEALLRKWPRLRSWLDEDREFLLGIQQLEQDMALWQSASRANKPRALLKDLKLEKGRAWLLERDGQISPEVNAFIRTSQRQSQRQRLTLGLTIAAVSTAISVAGGQALWQRGKASTAQAFQFAANSRAFINSDPFASVVYGLAAAEHGEEAMAQPVLTTNTNGLTLIVARDDEESKLADPIHVLRVAIANNFAISAPIPIPTELDSTLDILALKSGGILVAFDSGRLSRWRDEMGFENLVRDSQGSLASITQLGNGDIISGGENGALTVWRWRNNKLEVYGGPEPSRQLKVTGIIELENNYLVSSGSDGSLQLWEFQNGHFRRISKQIDASSNHSSIIGMIDLENGEIATADSSSQEVIRWRFRKHGGNYASLDKTNHDNNRLPWSSGISPNNFATFGRGQFVYPVTGGTLYISCEGGGKTLLSDSENQSLKLNYSNVPVFDTLTCSQLTPRFVLVRDGSMKVDQLLATSNSGFPLAVLWLGSRRFIIGNQRGYITLWNSFKTEDKRIASSHSSVRKLIILGNGEIVSLGANDYYSPRYISYGVSDSLRRWRNPDAQKRIVDTLRTAKDLRSIVAIGCTSIDLNSIAERDPVATAAAAAKRACRKLGDVK